MGWNHNFFDILHIQFWVLSSFSHSHLLLNNCAWNCTGRVIGLITVCNGLTGLNSSGACIKQMCRCRKCAYQPEERTNRNSKRKRGSKWGGGRGWGRDNGVQKRKVLNESVNKTKISRGMNRGEGGVKTKKTLYGRGMDIFWKTQSSPISILMVDNKICVFCS